MKHHETHPLTVLINNEPQLTYDRSKDLPANQRDYLERMDRMMDAGIDLGGQRLESPDSLQRAQFVAVQLVEALRQNNDALMAASCAWLADRMPELKQVSVSLVDDGFSIELVFDDHYAEEVSVSFTPRLSS